MSELQQPLTARGVLLASRKGTYVINTLPNVAPTKQCPQQVLVLDITPYDAVWAHIRGSSSL